MTQKERGLECAAAIQELLKKFACTIHVDSVRVQPLSLPEESDVELAEEQESVEKFSIEDET